MTHRPNSNTYWIEPGRLLAGEYPGAPTEPAARRKLQSYLDAGIRCFIDLTEANEGLAPYQSLAQELAATMGVTLDYHRHPIPDVSVPGNRDVMTGILDAIDDALRRDLPVYVHCWGGVGRTATVIGCHLVRIGQSPSEALQLIARQWKTVGKFSRKPRSPETSEQERYVLDWPERRSAP